MSKRIKQKHESACYVVWNPPIHTLWPVLLKFHFKMSVTTGVKNFFQSFLLGRGEHNNSRRKGVKEKWLALLIKAAS